MTDRRFDVVNVTTISKEKITFANTGSIQDTKILLNGVLAGRVCTHGGVYFAGAVCFGPSRRAVPVDRDGTRATIATHFVRQGETVRR